MAIFQNYSSATLSGKSSLLRATRLADTLLRVDSFRPAMGQNSMIDQTAFERLLFWLNPDRDKAAEKYEAVRRRLIEIFASRGFPDAERLADDTIDRVTLKVEKIMEGWVGDPVYYFLGVARKVILERKRLPPVVIPPPPPDDDEKERREREDQCLERCLAVRPQGDRELILYYVDGNKKQR